MSIDQQILATCIKSRKAYESIKEFAKGHDFSPTVGFWWGQLAAYYERDRDVSTVDVAVLREIGLGTITNPKQTESTAAVLDGLPQDVSVENVVSLVLDMRKRNLVMELAANIHNPKKSEQVYTELSTIWGKSDLVKPSEVEYAKDWDKLDTIVGSSRRVPFGVASLDRRIGGGVLPGHNVLIFGRTEIGKSCLTISLAANLIKQGKTLLYVGNEDSIHLLKARMRTSLLGWPESKIWQLPKKASRLLTELAADRLTMASLYPGSISELQDLVEKHTPQVLVLDQIRNLTGPEDGMTQRLESNAIAFRSLLSKKQMIGISVTQAGDRSQGHNSDGPLYLSAGDVDSSRVGLPGTLDLMLGVGANREMMQRGLRMISFAKNKLSSDPSAREPLVLRFDLTTSQVTDGE
jgi:archaellum biogenesis ATPase FlaH